MSNLIAMAYDTDLLAPGCALVQAAFGCSTHTQEFQNFNPTHWLLAPTPGMKKLEATPEQWAFVLRKTEARWGNNRPVKS